MNNEKGVILELDVSAQMSGNAESFVITAEIGSVNAIRRIPCPVANQYQSICAVKSNL